MEVDPLNPMSHGMRGYALQIHGDLHGGLEETQIRAEASPPGTVARFFLAHDLALVGRYDEALVILRREFGSGAEYEGSAAPTARLLRVALEEDQDAMDEVVTEEVREVREQTGGDGISDSNSS